MTRSPAILFSHGPPLPSTNLPFFAALAIPLSPSMRISHRIPSALLAARPSILAAASTTIFIFPRRLSLPDCLLLSSPAGPSLTIGTGRGVGISLAQWNSPAGSPTRND